MTSTSVCAHASFGVFAIAANSNASSPRESNASVEMPCSEERMRVLYKTAARTVTPPHFAAVRRGG